MKKTLSLILAALMCAAMTPAVMAEEVTEVPAVEEAVVVDVAVDVVVNEALIALAASLNITIPAEMAEALLAADVAALTVESIKTGALVFGVELPDEAAAAILALLVPAVDDTDVIGEAEAVTEIAVAEEAVVEEIAEEAIVEEVVEEEVSKYPVILEKTPTFGLFTKILSKFTFRG